MRSAMSNHRYSTWMLFAIAFADSSFLPVPPDLLLIPMSLLRPERMRFLVVVCILGSSLGAVAGYLIGYGLWSLIGATLMELYGYTEKFLAYQQLVEEELVENRALRRSEALKIWRRGTGRESSASGWPPSAEASDV